METEFSLRKSAERLGLKIPALDLGGADYSGVDDAASAVDAWFLSVVEEVATKRSAPNKPASARGKSAEFRDLGAIVSVLGIRERAINDALVLDDPQDSPGARAVIDGVIAMLRIDANALIGEIAEIRKHLSPHPLQRTFFISPSVAVLGMLDRSLDANDLAYDPAAFADAVFHRADAFAFTAYVLIATSGVASQLAPEIEQRLDRLSNVSSQIVAALASHIWPDSWERKLQAILDRPARNGVHFIAEKLREKGHESDPGLIAQVFRLLAEAQVEEAGELAASLQRFPRTPLETPALRSAFDFWLEHQPPFRNGEYSYQSPLVPLGQLLEEAGSLTGADRNRLSNIDRSDIRSFLKNKNA